MLVAMRNHCFNFPDKMDFGDTVTRIRQKKTVK
jgi:hypothetical protein